MAYKSPALSGIMDNAWSSSTVCRIIHHIRIIQRPHMAPAALMQNVKIEKLCLGKEKPPYGTKLPMAGRLPACSPARHNEVEKIYNYIKTRKRTTSGKIR